jgi:hypothetical protein
MALVVFFQALAPPPGMQKREPSAVANKTQANLPTASGAVARSANLLCAARAARNKKTKQITKFDTKHYFEV